MEKKRLKTLLLIMFSAVTLWAQTEGGVSQEAAADSVETALPWPQNMQRRLDSLMQDKMLKTSQLGLMVYDLTADSTLYAVNECHLLRPASTMKLLTAITALDRLGGNYQLRTRLCYKGTISNGTLTGDLYCVGGFDPLFSADDLNAFASQLVQMGVDTIRGRILADRSMKEPLDYGEGWCWDDDNPVLSPLTVGKKDHFIERFVQALQEAEITVDAETGEGTLPTGACTICTRSHSIDQVLQPMLKDSNNFFAEAIFYHVAAASGAHPAKASDARNSIKRMIGKTGLNQNGYRIADGSGLSLYNYVSAELETRLLRYAWRTPTIYEHLFPALPIANVDGTLRKRMQNTYADSNVHAKTGTLTGIISLAGYCTAANGHQLCFCIINQGVMQTSPARAFQDRVCNALCEP